MTLVVDASVAVRWMVRQPGSEAAEQVLASGERLMAPELVVAEVGSALWKYLRASLLQPDVALQALMQLPQALDELVPLHQLGAAALSIATELGHPVYDCFCLALADSQDCRVVTADRRLVEHTRNDRWSRRVVGLATFAP